MSRADAFTPPRGTRSDWFQAKHSKQGVLLQAEDTVQHSRPVAYLPFLFVSRQFGLLPTKTHSGWCGECGRVAGGSWIQRACKSLLAT